MKERYEIKRSICISPFCSWRILESCRLRNSHLAIKVFHNWEFCGIFCRGQKLSLEAYMFFCYLDVAEQNFYGCWYSGYQYANFLSTLYALALAVAFILVKPVKRTTVEIKRLVMTNFLFIELFLPAFHWTRDDLFATPYSSSCSIALKPIDLSDLIF